METELMEQLPTEILLLIFNKLNINDLINSASHVCERWRRIIAQDSVRQDKVTAIISAYTQSSNQPENHNNLIVNNVLDRDDLDLLRHCKTLHIYLTANVQTPCNFHYFPTLFHACMFLQTNTLKVSVATNKTCSYVPTNICFDFEMGSIIEIINMYPDLEYLHLDILFISKKDAVRLTDILQKKEFLKFVDISMAIPLSNRIRSSNEHIEPMQLNKLFYFANIAAKINASYMLQFLFNENVEDVQNSDRGEKRIQNN
ncbi:hypothetical protein M8J76_010183 [Diaphorina citri]|nr:hypothetical protein M8J76_010183 [Diaphorina citri]